MEKIKVYLDFDDTIVNSSVQIIELLNQKYGTNKTIEDLRDWGYRSIVGQVTTTEVMELFESDGFWNGVKLKDAFKEFYVEHKDKFSFTIVSKGTPENLKQKSFWIKQNLSECEFIGLGFENGMSKESVDMTGGIQIDDVTACLLKTKAEIRILLSNGRRHYWNEKPVNEDNLYFVDNWEQIKTCLLFFFENPEFIKRIY